MEKKFSEPVAKLLEIGEPEWSKNWLDYREYGVTSDDIPELIKMATDKQLHWAESESDEVWGPVHAWRALGGLRAEAAVNPLLNLFQDMEGDDYFSIDMPEVFARIGPAALPALAVYLSYPYRYYMARGFAGECIEAIGLRYPETREQCIQYLQAALEDFEENDPTLNGFLVSCLVGLDAESAMPLIQAAYESDTVDETVIDFPYVLAKIGKKLQK